jgi:hypothetical protein
MDVDTYYNDVRFERGDLVPMLPAQPGVCDVCHQGAPGTRCVSCARSVKDLVMRRPPRMLPIALRVVRTPFAHATWAYKDSSDVHDRDTSARQLAWLVWHFMSRHEQCLAQSIGAERFDRIVPMPSSGKRTGKHPLVTLLQRVPWSADRLADDLYYTGHQGGSHRVDEQRYDYRGDRLDGRPVLLFDDTFTSGGNVFSALDALAPTRAKIAVAIIGRHFDPSYSNATMHYYEHAMSIPFHFDVCALCDDRSISQLPAADPPNPTRDPRNEPAQDPWGIDADEPPF